MHSDGNKCRLAALDARQHHACHHNLDEAQQAQETSLQAMLYSGARAHIRMRQRAGQSRACHIHAVTIRDLTHSRSTHRVGTTETLVYRMQQAIASCCVFGDAVLCNEESITANIPGQKTWDLVVICIIHQIAQTPHSWITIIKGVFFTPLHIPPVYICR